MMDREVAAAMVALWRQDSRFMHIPTLRLACLEAGVVVGTIEELESYLSGDTNLGWMVPARRFFDNYFHVASEMLWDGKSDEQVIERLCRSAPQAWKKPRRKRAITQEQCPQAFENGVRVGRWKIHFREVDKRHDWGTVK